MFTVWFTPYVISDAFLIIPFCKSILYIDKSRWKKKNTMQRITELFFFCAFPWSTGNKILVSTEVMWMYYRKIAYYTCTEKIAALLHFKLYTKQLCLLKKILKSWRAKIAHPLSTAVLWQSWKCITGRQELALMFQRRGLQSGLDSTVSYIKIVSHDWDCT